MNFRTILNKFNHLKTQSSVKFIEAMESKDFVTCREIIPEMRELSPTEFSKFKKAYERQFSCSHMDYDNDNSAYDRAEKRARREAKRFKSLEDFNRWSCKNESDEEKLVRHKVVRLRDIEDFQSPGDFQLHEDFKLPRRKKFDD